MKKEIYDKAKLILFESDNFYKQLYFYLKSTNYLAYFEFDTSIRDKITFTNDYQEFKANKKYKAIIYLNFDAFNNQFLQKDKID